MALAAEEFIRRFLLHVLPEGFQRIRHYGFLANRYRAQKLALCRQLLQMPPPAATDGEVKKDYRDRYEELTGTSLKTCPACRRGQMVVIEVFQVHNNSANHGYVMTAAATSPLSSDRHCAIARPGQRRRALLHIALRVQLCRSWQVNNSSVPSRHPRKSPVSTLRRTFVPLPERLAELQCP
jgi:hypothetical protein